MPKGGRSLQVKGMVVEIDKDSIVVMTADGEFVELPRQGCPRLGQAVNIGRPGRTLRVLRKTLAAVAAALILVIGLVRVEVPYAGLYSRVVQTTEQKTAGIKELATEASTYYVALEPAPGVELSVGQGETITAAMSLGAQGATAAKLGCLAGKKLYDGLAELLRAARDAKEFSCAPDEVILLSVTSAGDAQAREELARELAGYVAKLLPELGIKKTQVVALSGDLGSRTAARAQNLSIGPYLAYLKAKEEGLKVTPSDVRSKGLKAALEAAGGQWLELFAGNGKVAAGELVPALQASHVLQEDRQESVTNK